ncbi:unnamed protein product [Urochloa humidicola]
MVFPSLAPPGTDLLASARVSKGAAFSLQATSKSNNNREASDGTYRHGTHLHHRLAALGRRLLGLRPGLDRKPGSSTGRGRPWGGRRDDGARAGAEPRRWRGCGSRVQAPEPRRAGPPTSLGDHDAPHREHANCYRKIHRGFLWSIRLALSLFLNVFTIFVCLSLGAEGSLATYCFAPRPQ